MKCLNSFRVTLAEIAIVATLSVNTVMTVGRGLVRLQLGDGSNQGRSTDE